ncbi:NAD-dependent epimerase/dehydratase family protein [Streptomyces sp. RGM 3693]|uniref:NAD-dependent epimerase/dehydratase family protein n=1 Tax=Streptomyces sp. RGM 3693 TaxID=3413284 RepID=UPI003D2C500E
MRILVLGGTWFLGKEVVCEAQRRGWKVATFNRGRSGQDVPGVAAIRGDRQAARDLERLAQHGPWDAVIDTSSSDLPPRDVLLAANALAARTARWVHISTVSVYSGWPHDRLTEESQLLECPTDADETFGYTGPDGSPTEYGFQKAGGERAVREALGDRAVFLRPGVILGPGEYVGRLPWWLRRAHRGGPLLVPSPADRRIQPVDVRDVAHFAIDQAATPGRDAYNVAHPQAVTFEEFVQECIAVTGGAAELVWAPPELLGQFGVRQWTELPLWRTHAGAWSVESERAVSGGLRCRPLSETIRDTWAWLQSGGLPVEHPRWAKHGIAPGKEREILSALGVSF